VIELAAVMSMIKSNTEPIQNLDKMVSVLGRAGKLVKSVLMFPVCSNGLETAKAVIISKFAARRAVGCR
jgi:hypothetical protein